MSINIIKVIQTPFIRKTQDGAMQRLRVTLSDGTDSRIEDVYIKAPDCEKEETIELIVDGRRLTHTVQLKAARPMNVHLVQLSHHDLGYTDVPSRVYSDMNQWILDALDMADKHENNDPDLRFRIVLEQAWSVEHFRKTANPKDWERLKDRIKSGDFELTALYGNQITEIMNSSEMRKLLAPSQRIAQELGVRLVSAEHNDETGVSWGLCQAMADADVKVICPGFALYYRWGDGNMPSFWDEEAVFGRIYQPGAFWWEAPDGKRVLLWCNNIGCGGDNSCTLDSLEWEILRLSDLDWPDSVLRLPVGGADRDNAPYSDGWISAAKKWNEEWSSPRIIISTNARFYEDYMQKLSRELPVRRGDLPGQDYPPGAMSIPEVAVAAHGAATTLEQIMPLAEVISAISGYDTAHIVDQAYDNLLLAHEHAWGFHFPAGYAARASQIEKLAFAVRAEAFADELRAKSMALLADRIQSNASDMRLVVYNPGEAGDLAMEVPLREFDNTGSQMEFYNDGTPRKRGYLLVNRMHVTPPSDNFKLIDIETGEEMPIEVSKIEADTPERFASERHALAQGTRRLSLFELPEGLGRTMRFVARNVPSQGYRTYKVVPCEEHVSMPENKAELTLENDFYRIEADSKGIAQIVRKSDGQNMFDSAFAYRPLDILVRHGNDMEPMSMEVISVDAQHGKVAETLLLHARARGIPQITICVRLWTKLPRIDISARILRDGEGLLNAHIAFPFTGKGFCYDGPLCKIRPVEDYLPGAQSDSLAVTGSVYVQGTDWVFTPLSTPIVSLGGLWQGYVSQAHRCQALAEGHAPLSLDDYQKNGHVYSMLFSNNYGTNFTASGSGEVLYRFRIGAYPDGASIFTDRSKEILPAVGTLAQIINK